MDTPNFSGGRFKIIPQNVGTKQKSSEKKSRRAHQILGAVVVAGCGRVGAAVTEFLPMFYEQTIT